MSESKSKPGAKPGNQHALGNRGNKNATGQPKRNTQTFNLTLPNLQYQQLESMRQEGYGSKSEILKMFIAARFDAWRLELREISAALEARDLERRRNAPGKFEVGDEDGPTEGKWLKP